MATVSGKKVAKKRMAKKKVAKKKYPVSKETAKQYIERMNKMEKKKGYM
jgi:hypothetical protein